MNDSTSTLRRRIRSHIESEGSITVLAVAGWIADRQLVPNGYRPIDPRFLQGDARSLLLAMDDLEQDEGGAFRFKTEDQTA